MSAKQIEILRKKWSVRQTKLEDEVRGYCTSPLEPHRKILLNKTLHGEALLDTLLHEMMHAGLWCLDEWYVTQLATDMARAAYKLGFKHESEFEE